MGQQKRLEAAEGRLNGLDASPGLSHGESHVELPEGQVGEYGPRNIVDPGDSDTSSEVHSNSESENEGGPISNDVGRSEGPPVGGLVARPRLKIMILAS